MQEELKTYIYDDKEVVLTGRVALSKNNVPKLVEVVPVGENINNRSYAKWVKLDELLTVVEVEHMEIDTDET